MSTLPTETATFAAGCFWGVESLFRQTEGVITTRVGYSGGHSSQPTYTEVCTDKTGHAEAVEIIFDPGKISYARLLEIFWENHNPTTLNRQGPDVGSQYRSVIFYHSDEQARIARESKQVLEKSGKFRQPIVTEIIPASTFYPAEEYHQNYYHKHGLQSCNIPGDKKNK